ncbi:AAA family ATPase [Prevotella pallens]|jgi:rloA|uniref:AAA family ATPase n=1 Tax=Prevotella pallens TaxID=60133 RepID=UPI001CAB9E33|nr:ATP-binding protein [Prevotella pallens]MBF1463186.1 ATP-binding protein [Prevotella pallens]MBF1483075.1 ATP-binding protein [Prevotella pallens]
MLLRVILKNFLSFDDEVQFDMFPNTKKTSLTDHISLSAGKLPVLKMAALYGANGAGKSNLMKGIEFVKLLTTKRGVITQSNVSRFFYALRKDAGSCPIELALEFVTKDGQPFIYSVSISKNGIESETLKLSGLGFEPNVDVFVRQNDGLVLAQKPSDEIEQMIKNWLERNPFDSLLTINNEFPVLQDSNVNAAQRWFDEELIVIGLHSFSPTLINIFRNNEPIKMFASSLFAAIDLGISEVKVQTENFDDWIRSHSSTELPMEKLENLSSGGVCELINFRNTKEINVENGVRKISQMLFEQFGKDNFSCDMDIVAQSDGTVRLLSLVPAFYYAMKEGRTVLIDELDHSIHPHLVRGLVRFFSRQKTNGQLIFTTHQTCLLNKDFIRTDEVWLVEKKDGSSRMYSLNDYKIHKTINLENGYMEGRYGAIPFIGELNM